MAKIHEFVLRGEEFLLSAYYDDDKRMPIYRVEMVDTDRPVSHEELLDMVSRMRRDMEQMFYQWGDGKLDNQMVNMMERDWSKENETGGKACRG